jgi:D-amino-acid dehydrogenase
MSSTSDVVIVGGGVVGLACAHALERRGIGVAVFEAAGVGGGASRGNTGWVVPSLSMPLAAPGMLATGLRSALDPHGALVIRPRLDASWLRWLWQFRRNCSAERFRRGVLALVELNRTTLAQFDAYAAEGVVFESHAEGMLIVARDRKGLSWFTSLHGELVRAGFEGAMTELGAAQARELEPALSDAVGAALHTSVDRHVRPESLTAGLAAAVRARGVEIREGAPVTALTRDGGEGADGGGEWRLTLAGGEVRRVRRVVIAAGAATAALLAPLGVRLPLMGAKGYSVDLRGAGEAPRTALYLSEPKLGLSPFADGVRVAGVFELPARSTAVSPGRIGRLITDTVPYLRSWRPAPGEESSVRGWAGVRPATPDSLPLLGPLDGFPGLYVASGHGMLGVTLAPATGLAIADMIERGRVAPELEPFRPLRRP